MVSLSRAEHQPSSSRAMLISPRESVSINFSGTSVSLKSIASRRQQHALQDEHVALESGEVEKSFGIVSFFILMLATFGYAITLDIEGESNGKTGVMTIIMIPMTY